MRCYQVRSTRTRGKSKRFLKPGHRWTRTSCGRAPGASGRDCRSKCCCGGCREGVEGKLEEVNKCAWKEGDYED